MTVHALNGLQKFGLSSLWQVSEDYLSVGKTVNQVSSVENRKVCVTSATNQTPLIRTIVKIVSYLTLILPLLALIIKSIYRKNYNIEFVKEAPGTVVQPTPAVENSFFEKDDPNIKPFDPSKYSLGEVINKVKEATAKGLKTAVYVGRMDNVVLPKEEGWYWVSLSESMQREFVEERPHLKMDPTSLRSITGLFNKVVFDHEGCGMSSFDEPWDELRLPLVQKPDSELIVCAGPQIIGMIPNASIGTPPNYYPERAFYEVSMWDKLDFYKEEKRVFEDWKRLVGDQTAELRYAKFRDSKTPDELAEAIRMSNGTEEGLRLTFMRLIIKEEKLQPVDPTVKYQADYLQHVKTYLDTLFNQVELHNETFPYPVMDKKKLRYWSCLSPK